MPLHTCQKYPQMVLTICFINNSKFVDSDERTDEPTSCFFQNEQLEVKIEELEIHGLKSFQIKSLSQKVIFHQSILFPTQKQRRRSQKRLCRVLRVLLSNHRGWVPHRSPTEVLSWFTTLLNQLHGPLVDNCVDKTRRFCWKFLGKERVGMGG